MAGGIYNNFGFGKLTIDQFKQIDTDQDGKVSKNEYLEFYNAQDSFDRVDFSVIDTNKSNLITEDEMILMDQKVKMGEYLDKFIDENIKPGISSSTELTKVKKQYRQKMEYFINTYTSNKNNDVGKMCEAFVAELAEVLKKEQESEKYLKEVFAQNKTYESSISETAKSAQEDKEIDNEEAKALMKVKVEQLLSQALNGDSITEMIGQLLKNVEGDVDQDAIYKAAKELQELGANAFLNGNYANTLEKMNELALKIVQTAGPDAIVETENAKKAEAQALKDSVKAMQMGKAVNIGHSSKWKSVAWAVKDVKTGNEFKVITGGANQKNYEAYKTIMMAQSGDKFNQEIFDIVYDQTCIEMMKRPDLERAGHFADTFAKNMKNAYNIENPGFNINIDRTSWPNVESVPKTIKLEGMDEAISNQIKSEEDEAKVKEYIKEATKKEVGVAFNEQAFEIIYARVVNKLKEEGTFYSNTELYTSEKWYGSILKQKTANLSAVQDLLMAYNEEVRKEGTYELLSGNIVEDSVAPETYYKVSDEGASPVPEETKAVLKKETTTSEAKLAIEQQKATMRARVRAIFVTMGIAFDQTAFNTAFTNASNATLANFAGGTLSNVMQAFTNNFNEELVQLRLGLLQEKE